MTTAAPPPTMMMMMMRSRRRRRRKRMRMKILIMSTRSIMTIMTKINDDIYDKDDRKHNLNL